MTDNFSCKKRYAQKKRTRLMHRPKKWPVTTGMGGQLALEIGGQLALEWVASYDWILQSAPALPAPHRYTYIPGQNHWCHKNPKRQSRLTKFPLAVETLKPPWPDVLKALAHGKSMSWSFFTRQFTMLRNLPAAFGVTHSVAGLQS